MSVATTVPQPTDAMDKYRYKRFTTSLLLRDLHFRKEAAAPGDMFPEFELFTTEGARLTNDDIFTGKPVIFIFGSMTCPMTASAAPSVQKLFEEFGDRINFVMLYVREAHPGEYFVQSETMEQKLEYARALRDHYNIQWTVAADNIDGDLHRTLDPKPNSAFLTDQNGMILFRSLWASDYDALRQALGAAASGRALETTQSVKMIGPVARAMGHVQDVMHRGGPHAVKDLWRAGFPMALAGRVATLFSPLTRDQRGIVASLTVALGFLAAIILVAAWAIV